VNNGVTLTIEPGVTVKFDTTKTLQIDGELLAIGTAQGRITFTATDTTPVRGSWGRIQFSPNSTDAVFDTAGNYISGSILKYCDIRYGGGVPGNATVYCDTSSPYFSHCRISDCLRHAVYFNQAGGKVDSSSIMNCVGTALHFNSPVAADLIVKNDTLEYNGGGVYGGYSSFANVTIKSCQFSNSDSAINIQSILSSIITDNIFTANTYAISGALGANINISNNVFTAHAGSWDCFFVSIRGDNVNLTNNYFENDTGAIYMTAGTFAVIQGNTFLNNRFYSNNCFVTSNDFLGISGKGLIANNIFDGNTTSSAYGVYLIHENDGKLEIADNLFKNNFPVTINCGAKPNICSNKFLNNSGTVIYSSPAYNSLGSDSYIHGNEFLDNSGTGAIISIVSNLPYYPNNDIVINSNEFRGDSTTGNPIISINSARSTALTNNRFLNNSHLGYPTVIVLNSNSDINNNDFLSNSGLSCMRISGTPQPIVMQNNFVNPGVQYEIENQIQFGPGANINVTNNYWGTTSTTHIDSVIKDYFDDANLSVALYPPVLSSPAFVDTSASCISPVCAVLVSGAVVNASCYGGSNGSINITVSNSTTPNTYVWNNGASAEDVSNLTSGSYTVTVIDANFCSATKSFTLTQPSSAVTVVSGVVANANCNTGGSISISAGGGTSPYTYNWGSGITTQNRTGLNPGNYSVTVRDNNNCTATQSFTVGQDAGPVINGTVTNTSCNNGCDGAINLSVTGIAPFTYDWGNGFGTSEDTTALCAGNYNVTVADSNNCGIAATFTITSPVVLNAAASITTDVSCFGYSDGSALAIASGGTPPYSFLWSNGQTAATATGLSAGAYDVTATDSLGCTAAASVTIPDGHHVDVGVIIGFNSAEINQPTLYSVNANSSYSFNWSITNGIITSGQGTNGIEVIWTVAGAGFVQLIGQEQGCADTASKQVTVIDTTRNCSAQFYLYPDTVPHSYFIVNTASGIPQLSYSWDWGDGSIDTVPYPSHTYSAPGFYTICLTITDSAGCTDTYCNPYYLLKTEGELSAMIHVNVISPSFTGVHDAALSSIELYPNPTSGTVTLKSANVATVASLRLYDSIGKQIIQQSVAPNELQQGILIDMKKMGTGIFFLSIKTESGTRVMKVVKY